MSPLEIIRLVDAAIALAISAGINIDRYNALRAQSASGKLTDEQLQELASGARQRIEDL